jgi:CheY-like chemotaxis protein
LLVINEPVLAGIVTLALNHGQYVSRVTASAHEAAAMLTEWRPHLLVLDMDIDGSGILRASPITRARDHRRRLSRSPGVATSRRSWRPSSAASTTS